MRIRCDQLIAIAQWLGAVSIGIAIGMGAFLAFRWWIINAH